MRQESDEQFVNSATEGKETAGRSPAPAAETEPLPAKAGRFSRLLKQPKVV